jgi:hypothetical protein
MMRLRRRIKVIYLQCGIDSRCDEFAIAGS